MSCTYFVDCDSQLEANLNNLDDWYGINEPCLCLFCSKTMPSADEIYLHCFDEHKFNIYEFKNKHNFDCYIYIKFVNFLRSGASKNLDLSNINAGFEPWIDERYLTPHLQNDPLLCFDIDNNNSSILSSLKLNNSPNKPLICDNCENFESIQSSDDSIEYLSNKLKLAQSLILEYQQKLEAANMDIQQMRDLMKRVVDDGGNKFIPINNSEYNSIEKVYFDSYAHYSIHEEMIKDKVRTETYMNCILGNADLFKDAVVLDVGCGTGILSLFAAKAGAKLVISVEMSDIVYNAMDIVIKNQFEDRIKVLKGRIEDVKLPVDKVDIIISEWMGYCLLYESMLDSVLYARDKYLTENGILLPSRTTINLVGISDASEAQVSFWDNVYGFNMSCMKSQLCEETIVECVAQDKIITNLITLKSFDLSKCLVSDLDFTTEFILKSNSNSKITALVLFFDVYFECQNPFSFSTSPNCTPTHWKQTVLNLKDPIDALINKDIFGKIRVGKNSKDHRALNISLSLDDKKQNFYMQ